jgi:hypothetical protein
VGLGWFMVIPILIVWHDINLGCAGAVAGIEKCIFGGVKLGLVLVDDYIRFIRIDTNFKLLVLQLL